MLKRFSKSNDTLIYGDVLYLTDSSVI